MLHTQGEQQTTKGCLLWSSKTRLKKSCGAATTLQKHVQKTSEVRKLEGKD